MNPSLTVIVFPRSHHPPLNLDGVNLRDHRSDMLPLTLRSRPRIVLCWPKGVDRSGVHLPKGRARTIKDLSVPLILRIIGRISQHSRNSIERPPEVATVESELTATAPNLTIPIRNEEGEL